MNKEEVSDTELEKLQELMGITDEEMRKFHPLFHINKIIGTDLTTSESEKINGQRENG